MKNIRSSLIEDIPALVEMSVKIWNEKPEDKKAYFLKTHKRGELFVHSENGMIKGYITCLINYWGDCNFIDEIGVLEEFRREGIASGLIQHAIKISASQNKRRIFSSFNAENISSFQLHLKNNFKVAGQINNMFVEDKSEIIVSIKL